VILVLEDDLPVLEPAPPRPPLSHPGAPPPPGSSVVPPPPVTCPSCGKPLEANAALCVNCGFLLNAHAVAARQQKTGTVSSPAERDRPPETGLTSHERGIPGTIVFRIVNAFLLCGVFVFSALLGKVPAAQPGLYWRTVDAGGATLWVAVGVGMLCRVKWLDIVGTCCAALLAVLGTLCTLVFPSFEPGAFAHLVVGLSWLFVATSFAKARQRWYIASTDSEGGGHGPRMDPGLRAGIVAGVPVLLFALIVLVAVISELAGRRGAAARAHALAPSAPMGEAAGAGAALSPERGLATELRQEEPSTGEGTPVGMDDDSAAPSSEVSSPEPDRTVRPGPRPLRGPSVVSPQRSGAETARPAPEPPEAPGRLAPGLVLREGPWTITVDRIQPVRGFRFPGSDYFPLPPEPAGRSCHLILTLNVRVDSTQVGDLVTFAASGLYLTRDGRSRGPTVVFTDDSTMRDCILAFSTDMQHGGVVFVTSRPGALKSLEAGLDVAIRADASPFELDPAYASVGECAKFKYASRERSDASSASKAMSEAAIGKNYVRQPSLSWQRWAQVLRIRATDGTPPPREIRVAFAVEEDEQAADFTLGYTPFPPHTALARVPEMGGIKDPNRDVPRVPEFGPRPHFSQPPGIRPRVGSPPRPPLARPPGWKAPRRQRGERAPEISEERKAGAALQTARNLLKNKRTDAAKRILQEIVEEYPGTAAAASAREELEKIKDTE